MEGGRFKWDELPSGEMLLHIMERSALAAGESGGEMSHSGQVAQQMLRGRGSPGWEGREHEALAALRESLGEAAAAEGEAAPPEEPAQERRSYNARDIPETEKNEGNAIYGALNALKRGDDDKAYVTPDDYNRLIAIIDNWAERFPGVVPQEVYDAIKSDESRNAVAENASRSEALASTLKESVIDRLNRFASGDFSGVEDLSELGDFESDLSNFEQRYPEMISDEMRQQIEAVREGDLPELLDDIESITDDFDHDGAVSREDQEKLSVLLERLREATTDLYNLVQSDAENVIENLSSEEVAQDERRDELVSDAAYYMDRYRTNGWLPDDERDNLQSVVYDFENEIDGEDLADYFDDLEDALSSSEPPDEDSADLGNADLAHMRYSGGFERSVEAYRNGEELSGDALDDVYRGLLAFDASNNPIAPELVQLAITAVKNNGAQPPVVTPEQQASLAQKAEARAEQLKKVAEWFSPATIDSARKDMEGLYAVSNEVLQETLNALGDTPSSETLRRVYGGEGFQVDVKEYRTNQRGASPGIYYAIDVRDSDGTWIATVQRNYSVSNITADYIAMADNMKDSIWAGNMLVREAQMAIAFGRKSMTCHANSDRGGYMWAKSGFDFASEHIADAAQERFQNGTERLFNILEDENVGKTALQDIQSFKEALQSTGEDLQHAWDYADLRMPIPSDYVDRLNEVLEDQGYYEARWRMVEEHIKGDRSNARKNYVEHLKGALRRGAWGKFMMMGTEWDAVLNLREGLPSRARVEKFTRRLDQKLLRSKKNG